MSTVTTKDGAQIYYKDWDSGQPIVFSHGCPLSAEDWDAQMIFFASRGFRCIAHDRRVTGDRPRRGTATRWTRMPTISSPSPRSST
jgi:non-heme chloroperoxidase